MNKQGKYFYLAAPQRIVYCHRQQHDSLLLSALAHTVNDALGCTVGQIVSENYFKKQKPVEINPDKISEYSFMKQMPTTGAWFVAAHVHHSKIQLYLPRAQKTGDIFSLLLNN